MKVGVSVRPKKRNKKVTPLYAKSSSKKRPHHSKQSARQWLVRGLLVIMGVICLTSLFQIRRTQQATASVKEEKKAAEAALLSEENNLAYLKDQETLLENEDYVAKLARSRFYLSKDDEIIFSLPEDNDSKRAKAFNKAYLKEQENAQNQKQ
ncbi:septum formation initiator family protein [Aerococcus sp. UMB1112A]|uniref:FtsB family cell division protein n=1 Tax=Aerococcus sp. UMB1112A TaxID=3050609 RepID=UPI00254B7DAD|nr:septum formation initiator family protein [Aerococcus sp. UMB1112A]MDK8502855.1 septum formation initiator family protein [Aerococcus sp. UMB1112A]